MPAKRYAEELSEAELRQLLIEKRRKSRDDQLDYYRKTGRVMHITPQAGTASLESMRSTLLDGADQLDQAKKAHTTRKKIINALLLVVEIGAVIGLVFIFLNSFNLLKTLNQSAAESMVLPTLTPTPLISAVVLPSGHMPPDASGSYRFNEDEIPAHLRPLVQSMGEIIIPTPGPEQAVRIQIPAIHVDHPIVQGDGGEQLKKGVGQHIGSANPGQAGNIILSAHNDIFGEIFRYLDQLQPGDQIIIFTHQKQYTYLVTETLIVLPTQVEVMAMTENATVTLISCYPYMVDNQRIIIKGELVSQ